MKLLLLHGWGGSDTPHWQAVLAAKVARNYGTVSFPLLDNPHFPSKNRWTKQVKAILEEFKPDTVVCHSLGCTLWFWLAQENIAGIERLFLVSPPSLHTKLDIIKSFFPAPLPAKLGAQEAHLLVSDNDPYIDIEEAKKIASRYQIPLHTIEQAGHINTDSGYGKWELIEELVMRSEK
jgi:predicted alpha/beta hydrolase family esterase